VSQELTEPDVTASAGAPQQPPGAGVTVSAPTGETGGRPCRAPCYRTPARQATPSCVPWMVHTALLLASHFALSGKKMI